MWIVYTRQTAVYEMYLSLVPLVVPVVHPETWQDGKWRNRAEGCPGHPCFSYLGLSLGIDKIVAACM